MAGAGPLNQLDDVIDHAPCGFVSIGDDGRLALVNATLLDMLGYEREELVGRHIDLIFPPSTRIFYQTHLFPLARLHGHAEEIFLQLRPKSGEDIGVFANVKRRGTGGAALYDFVIMRVRERQKYEEELLRARREADEARRVSDEARRVAEEARAQLEEQAAELEAATDELHAANEELVAQREESDQLRVQAEAASRAKTDFLAVMSHELRTPLNAISGYVQILEMGIQGPLTDAQRETLARVDRAQRHLLRLINDLLNLSKLEAGGVDYTIEDVVLAEAVTSVVPMIEPQATRKKLRLTIDVPATLTARADRDKLEQILLNLLSNATKFTPEEGRIRVHATLDPRSPDFAALSVSDTGVGIPKDKLLAVFEPFVQVDSGQSRPAEGTGLGLAISRDLARGMGGDLTVESELGSGSTFTVLLPAASD